MTRPLRIAPLNPPATRGRDHWTEDAACTSGNTYLVFFAAADGRPDSIHNARLICRDCPVQRECLREYGDLPHGVVGGKSAAERDGGEVPDEVECRGPNCDRRFTPALPQQRGPRVYCSKRCYLDYDNEQARTRRARRSA